MSSSPYETSPEQLAVAIGYSNAAYIADRVLPRVNVGKKGFQYNYFGTKGVYNLPEDLIGRKGRPQELEFGSEKRDGSVQDRGYVHSIPNDDVDEAVKDNMPDPVNRGTMKITDAVHRRREIRVADIVFNPDNYVHKVNLTDEQRLDRPDADPLPTLLELLDEPLVRPNVLTIGQGSWTKLRTHPKFVKAANGTSGDSGAISLDVLKDLLELDEVLLGKAHVDISKPGKASQFERAWDKHMSFTYRESILDQDNALTWGFTAQYGTWVAGHQQDADIGLRGGVRVKVGETVGETICAPGAGLLIRNATL